MKATFSHYSYRVWDQFDRESVPGLHVLVQPSGTKSYRVLYKLNGQSFERSVQVGRVGEVTLKQARAKAREVRALAADGTDIKSSDPKRSNTFKACVEEWVRDRTAKKPRVSDEKMRQFVLGATTAWHDRAVRTIRPKEIEALLADKRDNGRGGRGSKYAAVQLYSHLHTLFRWLAAKHNVEPNPMLKVDKPWGGEARLERKWFSGTHADDAIVMLWRLADRIGGDRGKFLQLLIIMMCRTPWKMNPSRSVFSRMSLATMRRLPSGACTACTTPTSSLNVTTGIRFHPIEILLSMGIKLGVVAALGTPAVAVLIFEILLNATSMFNHGNVAPARLDRVLRWMVVTPEMHRVHHSIKPRETNSNFGFNLPWWDRLFGTYRDQPEAGHVGMTIGIEQFRDAREQRLDRMLTQPFRDDVRCYPLGHREPTG
jgi:hypothetical protein